VKGLGVLFLLVSGLAAQPTLQAVQDVTPDIEVASIRLHTGMITVSGLDVSGSRVTVSASTVGDLIADAYRLKAYQLAGAAEWMRADFYDVVMKAAGEAVPTIDQARRMLRALLAERFALVAHWETKEMPVYALVVAKSGARLKENPAGSGVTRFNRKGRDVELVFSGTPLDSLIRQLPRMPGVDRPVLDETGLTGKYDFQLTLTDFQLGMNVEQRGIPEADAEGPSVFTALTDQLGLKLESKKIPLDVLVIDRAEKVPTEN